LFRHSRDPNRLKNLVTQIKTEEDFSQTSQSGVRFCIMRTALPFRDCTTQPSTPALLTTTIEHSSNKDGKQIGTVATAALSTCFRLRISQFHIITLFATPLIETPKQDCCNFKLNSQVQPIDQHTITHTLKTRIHTKSTTFYISTVSIISICESAGWKLRSCSFQTRTPALDLAQITSQPRAGPPLRRPVPRVLRSAVVPRAHVEVVERVLAEVGIRAIQALHVAHGVSFGSQHAVDAKLEVEGGEGVGLVVEDSEELGLAVEGS
jgi:hypothetical protein